jgi:dienelactone hydrolase
MVFALASARVPGVSAVIGNFMLYLHTEFDVKVKDITCIGFSLGGKFFLNYLGDNPKC